MLFWCRSLELPWCLLLAVSVAVWVYVCGTGLSVPGTVTWGAVHWLVRGNGTCGTLLRTSIRDPGPCGVLGVVLCVLGTLSLFSLAVYLCVSSSYLRWSHALVFSCFGVYPCVLFSVLRAFTCLCAFWLCVDVWLL